MQFVSFPWSCHVMIWCTADWYCLDERHFIRRFWNHTLTCSSVRPSDSASCVRGPFKMYWLAANALSKPIRCDSLKTAREKRRHVSLDDSSSGSFLLITLHVSRTFFTFSLFTFNCFTFFLSTNLDSIDLELLCLLIKFSAAGDITREAWIIFAAGSGFCELVASTNDKIFVCYFYSLRFRDCRIKSNGMDSLTWGELPVERKYSETIVRRLMHVESSIEIVHRIHRVELMRWNNILEREGRNIWWRWWWWTC